MASRFCIRSIITVLFTSCAGFVFSEDNTKNAFIGAAGDNPPGHQAVVAARGGNTLTLWAGGGFVEYEESAMIDSVNSDWDGSYGEIGGRWRHDFRKGSIGVLDLAFWSSTKKTETWRYGSEVVQRNDLEVNGFQMEGYLGKGWAKPDHYQGSGLVGLGFWSQDFARTNFSGPIADRQGSSANVGEQYTVVSFLLAGHGSMPISDAWDFVARGKSGFIFFNEADNDLFGFIEGSGGITLKGSAGVNWKFRESQNLGVLLTYELQDLDGDMEQRTFITEEGPVAGVVEWPDNELTRFGVEVIWAAEF